MANTKTPAVIFDLDNCVFDDGWRTRLIDNRKSGDAKYEEYHANLKYDRVFELSYLLIQNALQSKKFIIFVTARPEKWREATTNHIIEFLKIEPGSQFVICMRPDGDTRPSPELKKYLLANDLSFHSANSEWTIVRAFDDRQDVVDMYRSMGIDAYILDGAGTKAIPFAGLQPEDGPVQPTKLPEAKPPLDAGDMLAAMGKTFKERNAVYGNNAEVTGRVLAALFPKGVVLKTPGDYEIWHLFELIIVKLTRFTNSGLTHEDSIHDLAAYAAMVELLITKHNIQIIK